MTDKEFEGLFKESPELKPRAELKNEILARAKQEMEQRNGSAATTKIKSKASLFSRFKVWMPIAACLVLVLLVFGGVWGLNNEEYQTVYIDVNPSVAIKLNRFDNVSGVEYLNDDAKNALAGTELTGESAEDALEMVIEAYDKNGYFDKEAELFISADGESEELLERLKTRAEKIKGNKKYNVNTHALSKEEKEDAKDMDISPGKYRIISEIIEADPNYTVDALKDLSMSDLNKIHKSVTKNKK